MSTTPVHVLVTVDALPAHAEEISAGLRRLAEASLREDGCIAYDVLRDNAEPSRMLITETWRDGAALACHRASAHVASAIGSLQEKLAAAPQVRELSSLV